MRKEIRQALNELFSIAGCNATAEQLLNVAEQFDLPVHALEEFYMVEVDNLANE